jgi:hypothetical protein
MDQAGYVRRKEDADSRRCPTCPIVSSRPPPARTLGPGGNMSPSKPPDGASQCSSHRVPEVTMSPATPSVLIPARATKESPVAGGTGRGMRVDEKLSGRRDEAPFNGNERPSVTAVDLRLSRFESVTSNFGMHSALLDAEEVGASATRVATFLERVPYTHSPAHGPKVPSGCANPGATRRRFPVYRRTSRNHLHVRQQAEHILRQVLKDLAAPARRVAQRMSMSGTGPTTRTYVRPVGSTTQKFSSIVVRRNDLVGPLGTRRSPRDSPDRSSEAAQTQVQCTSACWHVAHRNVQYRSEPACK